MRDVSNIVVEVCCPSLCMVDLFYDTTWLYGVVEFASSSSHNIIPPRHLSSFSLILFVLYYLL